MRQSCLAFSTLGNACLRAKMSMPSLGKLIEESDEVMKEILRERSDNEKFVKHILVSCTNVAWPFGR